MEPRDALFQPERPEDEEENPDEVDDTGRFSRCVSHCIAILLLDGLCGMTSCG